MPRPFTAWKRGIGPPAVQSFVLIMCCLFMRPSRVDELRGRSRWSFRAGAGPRLVSVSYSVGEGMRVDLGGAGAAGNERVV